MRGGLNHDETFPWPIGTQLVTGDGRSQPVVVRGYIWPPGDLPASMVIGIPGYPIGYVVPHEKFGDYRATGVDQQLSARIDARTAAADAAGKAAEAALLQWLGKRDDNGNPIVAFLCDDECSNVELFELADGEQVEVDDEEVANELFELVGNVDRSMFRNDYSHSTLRVENLSAQ